MPSYLSFWLSQLILREQFYDYLPLKMAMKKESFLKEKSQLLFVKNSLLCEKSLPFGNEAALLFKKNEELMPR